MILDELSWIAVLEHGINLCRRLERRQLLAPFRRLLGLSGIWFSRVPRLIERDQSGEIQSRQDLVRDLTRKKTSFAAIRASSASANAPWPARHLLHKFCATARR